MGTLRKKLGVSARWQAAPVPDRDSAGARQPDLTSSQTHWTRPSLTLSTTPVLRPLCPRAFSIRAGRLPARSRDSPSSDLPGESWCLSSCRREAERSDCTYRRLRVGSQAHRASVVREAVLSHRVRAQPEARRDSTSRYADHSRRDIARGASVPRVNRCAAVADADSRDTLPTLRRRCSSNLRHD
jgi:hypothetical protein